MSAIELVVMGASLGGLNFARPSADALFESAADGYGERLLGVVLTGSNDDLAAGSDRARRGRRDRGAEAHGAENRGALPRPSCDQTFMISHCPSRASSFTAARPCAKFGLLE